MKRREMLQKTALITGGLSLFPQLIPKAFSDAQKINTGQIKHSVCRWPFAKIPLREFCEAIVPMGITSIDLTGPKEWEIMKEYGLTCAMGWGDYPEGINLQHFFSEESNHDKLYIYYKALVPIAKKYGIHNIICLSGDLWGKTHDEAALICLKGIKRVMPIFEDYDMTLSMELLNSKVDHKNQACDHTEWGVILCEMVGSPQFKLLYDIYHMQIMEGNLIQTIKTYLPYISHFHTGGCPGRHVIDDSQEIFYPAIIRALEEMGYTGYVAQEFIPTGTVAQQLAQLKKAIEICTV